MMDRRQFLRKGLVALAGGLIVGDAALEMLDQLTHKKVWAGWDAPRWGGKGEYFDQVTMSPSSLADLYRKINTDVVRAMKHTTAEMSWLRPYDSQYAFNVGPTVTLKLDVLAPPKTLYWGRG